MRLQFYLPALISVLLLAACDKSDIEYENSFEKSYSTWQSFKKSSDNSYRFTVTGDTWVGASWQTVLTVEKGKVTGRSYRYNNFYGIQRPADGWKDQQVQQILAKIKLTAQEFRERQGKDLIDMLEWTERPNELGTHEATSASPLITMDEVYEKARTDWLKKRGDATIYFEAKNNGLISSCGYIENGCQDDCFAGISISSVEPL